MARRNCPDDGAFLSWDENAKQYTCGRCGATWDKTTVEDHHHGRV